MHTRTDSFTYAVMHTHIHTYTHTRINGSYIRTCTLKCTLRAHVYTHTHQKTHTNTHVYIHVHIQHHVHVSPKTNTPVNIKMSNRGCETKHFHTTAARAVVEPFARQFICYVLRRALKYNSKNHHRCSLI
jgi:hypothetical protein